MNKAHAATYSGVYLTCGSSFDFTLEALKRAPWSLSSRDQRMKPNSRSDCLTDEGIEDELQELSISNANYNTLQGYISYDEFKQSSFSEYSFDSQTLETESEFYAHTSAPSSQILYIPRNIYKDQLIQTDYDPGFEFWYKNKYENFDQNDEELPPSNNRRKQVRTLFIRDDFKEDNYKKNNQRRRNKSILTKRKKPVEQRVSSTSYAYSPQPSKHEFHYHKSMKDNSMWVNLNAFENNPLTQYTTDPFEQGQKKAYNDHEDSISKSKLPSRINFPPIEVQIIKFTFDQFGLENKLTHFSERFHEKIQNNKLKQSMLNLSINGITENLKILKEIVSYDITNELIDEIVNRWNDLKIDMTEVIPKTVSLNINFDKDCIAKNQINYIQYEDLVYNDSPKLHSKSNNFEHIFHLFNEKVFLNSACKHRKINNRAKRLYTNLKFRNGETFLNCQTIQSNYDKKVKDFVKKVAKIRPIIISLRDKKMDLSSHKNMINELINNVVNPVVAQYKTFNPFMEWKPMFTTSMKKLPDSIFCLANKNALQLFNFGNEGRTTSNSINWVELTYCSHDNNTGCDKSTFSELRNMGDPFNVPKFDFGDEIVVKFEIQEIIQHLKGICINRQSLRKTLKTYLKLTFDVSDIIIKISINYAAITIGNLKQSIASFKLIYRRENRIRYNMKNLVKISLSHEHFYGKEKFFYEDGMLFSSNANEASIFKIVNGVQYTLKSILESLMPNIIKLSMNKKDPKVEKEYGNSENSTGKTTCHDLDTHSASSTSGGNKIVMDRLSQKIIVEVDIINNNHYMNKKNEKNSPRKKLCRCSMYHEYLDVNYSDNYKNNSHIIGNKDMTENLSNDKILNIHKYNNTPSPPKGKSSDQDIVHSEDFTLKSKIDPIMKREEKDLNVKETSTLSNQAELTNHDCDSILNLYEELSSHDSTKVNDVSYPKRKNNSNATRKEAKKNKTGVLLTESEVRIYKGKIFNTSNNIEILHEKIDNSEMKSTSTLALPENKFKQNNRDHKRDIIKVLHEMREENHDTHSMSTLALSERTKEKDSRKSKVMETRTNQNRNYNNIREKSPKPVNELWYEVRKNSRNIHINQLCSDDNQEKLLYPKKQIRNEIRQKSSDSNKYQLSDNDSILQLYRSLDSIYSFPVESTKDLIIVHKDNVKSNAPQANDELSLTSQGSLGEVSTKDSILELYLKLSREESLNESM